jgi:hypothetical protein
MVDRKADPREEGLGNGQTESQGFEETNPKCPLESAEGQKGRIQEPEARIRGRAEKGCATITQSEETNPTSLLESVEL